MFAELVVHNLLCKIVEVVNSSKMVDNEIEWELSKGFSIVQNSCS